MRHQIANRLVIVITLLVLLVTVIVALLQSGAA
jgi:hypothetical protein